MCDSLYRSPFKNRRLISSVASSVLSIVGQDSGPPSLYTAIVSVGEGTCELVS